MNLDKIYFTKDGKECNILQLVKLSPEWAANRIQEGEKAIEKLKKLNQEKEHTKNKSGMKVCLTGLLNKIANHKGQISGGYQFLLTELSKHFDQARKAWLDGDLHTVAEFFGLYRS